MHRSRFDVSEADRSGGCGPAKVLLSTSCLHDCGYCPNAATADREGETSTPEEVVEEFLAMQRSGFRGGLFLSSGVVRSAEHTQELLVEAAELARSKGYRGYLHVKVMPGAPRSLVRRAAESADRLSVNVETLPSRMGELSSTKHYGNDVERRLRWAAEAGAESGATTQLIVGGAGETDREVYDETARLYDRHGLRRVYFSPFRPVPGTGMADREATDPDRGARLYRLDWLRRVYGFSEEKMELAFDGEEAAEEPKLRVAERTGLRVDPEEAGYEELLRLPGVGPKRARRIARGDGEPPRKARPFLSGQTRLSGFA